MRRSAKYGTSHTVRHCCAGVHHKNTHARAHDVNDAAVGDPASKLTQHCCGLGRHHAATGGIRKAALCLGHNYNHNPRCGMCNVGDSFKSQKHQRGSQERRRWKDTLRACTRPEWA